MISSIITKLYQDTKIRAIQANQIAPTPPLPYAVYNITSPFIQDGRGIEYIRDRIAHYNTQYKQTISFNVYGISTDETIQKANDIRHWFLFFGKTFIQDQNIAVLEVTNLEDRTTFLVDSYEYKFGFDVRLRLSESFSKDVETIETVNIGG